MRNTTVIARRELVSVFTSPLAYIVGAGFLLLVGALFAWNFSPGAEASMRSLFTMLIISLVPAIPLLTMPLMSEEFSRGTIETMLTAPVSEVDLVLGKFLGMLAFFAALLACTLVHMAVLAAYSQPLTSQAVMGYVGLLLLGAAFISVGLFFSCMTRHQLLAALLSMVVLAAFSLVPELLVRHTYGLLHRLISSVSVQAYFADFARGILDSRGLVFFLSVTAFFLFVSVKVLESRRWR